MRGSLFHFFGTGDIMQPFANEQLKQMFEFYNRVFAQAYDKALNEDETYQNAGAANAEENLRNEVCNSIQHWHELPLTDDASGLTGGEVIDRVATLDNALDLARYAAAYCDDEFPDLVKVKLSTFGQPLIDGLLSFVLAVDFTVPADDMRDEHLDLAIAAEYLKLLGDWQCAGCLRPVVAKFFESAQPNEMLADAVRFFLSRVGETAIPVLLDSITTRLASGSGLDTAGEYLLIALTDLGQEYPSEAVYACLRDAFRKMEHKAIGAICLGDYGDGRGVTVLRGYLERHPELDDRQVIGEILSAIKRLGGETADLRHRLKIVR
jgi:hypothetical protein